MYKDPSLDIVVNVVVRKVLILYDNRVIFLLVTIDELTYMTVRESLVLQM